MDTLGQFGDFLGSAGKTFTDVYTQIKPQDKRQIKAQEEFNWKPVAVVGGVAVAVLVALKFLLK